MSATATAPTPTPASAVSVTVDPAAQSADGWKSTLPESLQAAVADLENLFVVDTACLKKVVAHFVKELEKGLSVKGGNIPMNVTWVLGTPTGNEKGTYISVDMGGTNLRVCRVHLTDGHGAFEIDQEKYRLPDNLKTGNADELWDFTAKSLHAFLDSPEHQTDKDVPQHQKDNGPSQLPLGFTFSYPLTQDFIDQGVLQRWTKGFDIDGVEGKDVAPMFEEALAKRNIPVELTALINDTTGTLVASSYKDPAVKIGCIFGTGVNAAYLEHAKFIPKIAHYNLPPETLVAINCEYGAFDNEHIVLPLTKYDLTIDAESARPHQQAFEKMTSGLYLGEIFRLVLLDYIQNRSEHHDIPLFRDQDISALHKSYLLDSSFLAFLEGDTTPDLSETAALIEKELNLRADIHERRFCRYLCQLIGTRSARLASCGIAAICTKKDIASCRVGADGAVLTDYPHYQVRVSRALREMLDWQEGVDDKVVVVPATDGSGVGAAVIAALTSERAKTGFLAGIRKTDEIAAL